LVADIESSLENLIQTFNRKSGEFADVKKLARTHAQDAVPTTLGAEMGSYSVILQRDKKRLRELYEFLNDLNLGGTAIGNKINASEGYIDKVYKELVLITGLKVEPAKNFMALTSSQSDYCHVSGLVTILAGDLSKIAKDLRFMASGPNGGIGEITLENLQPGSSIMPGKINPVIPEAIDQVFYFIAGKNATIQKASEDAHLELGIMFPILADSLINILKLIDSAIQVFDAKCISTLQANPEKCLHHLEKSTAYATLLTPVLGYDKVSEIVKKAVKQKKSIREVVLEEGLMNENEFEQAVTVQ
jgi:aspartate ammonia-lyase